MSLLETLIGVSAAKSVRKPKSGKRFFASGKSTPYEKNSPIVPGTALYAYESKKIGNLLLVKIANGANTIVNEKMAARGMEGFIRSIENYMHLDTVEGSPDRNKHEMIEIQQPELSTCRVFINKNSERVVIHFPTDIKETWIEISEPLNLRD